MAGGFRLQRCSRCVVLTKDYAKLSLSSGVCSFRGGAGGKVTPDLQGKIPPPPRFNNLHAAPPLGRLPCHRACRVARSARRAASPLIVRMNLHDYASPLNDPPQPQIKRSGLTKLMARGIIFLCRKGFVGLVARVNGWGMRIKGLQNTLKQVTLEVVERGFPHTVAQISWCGLSFNNPKPFQQLAALLMSDAAALKPTISLTLQLAQMAGEVSSQIWLAERMAPAVVMAVQWGSTPEVVEVSDALLQEGYLDFVVSLVLSLLPGDDVWGDTVVGKIGWQAMDMNRYQLVSELNVRLLERGHVEEAAAVAMKTLDCSTSTSKAADAMSRPIISAVDKGLGQRTAALSHMLVQALYEDAVLLTVLAVHDHGRPDVNGVITWLLVSSGFMPSAHRLSYLLASGGHIQTAAHATLHAFAHGDGTRLAPMFASAISTAVRDGHAGHAAHINSVILEEGGVNVAASIVLEQLKGEWDAEIGSVSWSAITRGKAHVVTSLGHHLITCGHIQAAARVNRALAQAGQLSKVSAVSCLSAISAVDAGHARNVASLNVALIEMRMDDLAGNVTVAVAANKRPDVLGRVSWGMLHELGRDDVFVHLSTWLLVNGHTQVAAATVSHVMELAGQEHQAEVAMALAHAVIQAVDAGHAGNTVIASDLMSNTFGLTDLLANINAHIVQLGRGDVGGEITRTAVRLGKVTLLGKLGGEMLLSGDITTAASVAGETLNPSD